MNKNQAPELYYVDHNSFVDHARTVANQIANDVWQLDFIIGIGRGGLVPAVYISHCLQLPMLSIDHSSKVRKFDEELIATLVGYCTSGKKLLFVDDINDSGGTIEHIRRTMALDLSNAENVRFAVLLNNSCSRANVDYFAHEIDRRQDQRWFVFPWEAVNKKETLEEEALLVPERLNLHSNKALD